MNTAATRRTRRRSLAALLAAGTAIWATALLAPEPAAAQCLPGEDCAPEQQPDIDWMNQPLTAIDGFSPVPWACNTAANGNIPDPGVQNVLAFHLNWHCANPDNSGPNWGARFLGFHRQFLRGYERFAAAGGFPNIQTFTPAPGAIIPPAHNGRPANTPCTGVNPAGTPANCQTLPNAFRTPAAGGTLNAFANENDLGNAAVGWHNAQHTRIGFASTAAGGFGACVSGDGTPFLPDIRCNGFAPRDPVFYRYHNLFNDIQDAWRTLQPTDVMIVFDRSGSMNLPTAGGGTRLAAAKNAANLFADLLDNAGPSRVGLVTFSSAAPAVPELALTNAVAAPAAMAAAVGPITASGMTSIGAGLQAAMATLAGSTRPAILLLTDGRENTAPTIAAAQPALGAAHVCAVGLGTPGSLDGPKLRDLAELQGGIYVSGPGDLQLRKFFVDCFADIFDTFVGMDPVQALEPGEAATPPMDYTVLGDRELVAVLSWSEAVAPGQMRLRVATPSGRVVGLAEPGVQSKMDALWHVVRVALPLAGEGDGVWTVQAVRGPRFFANGFTGDAFVDPDQGIELVRRQLRELCPAGCDRVLYFEDEMAMGPGMSFEDHNSVYAQALFYEVPFGTVGEVLRVRDPRDYAQFLRRGGFDLIVHASKVGREAEPFDEILSGLLCDPDGPPAIVSDNRQGGAAEAIWTCLGVKPTGELDWEAMLADGALLDADAKLAPYMPHGPFSFGLAPGEDRAAPAIENSVGSAASIVVSAASPPRQELFVNVLTSAAARVLPHVHRARTYTGEPLQASFRIPEAYWPVEGFDKVTAVVRVTRPLRGLGELIAKGGAAEPIVLEGDGVDARTAALLRIDPQQTGAIVGAETLEFELFDDGTNGDTTPGDRYWERTLPATVTAADGEYELHAIFTLCRGDACVQREARHRQTVEVKLDRGASGIEITPDRERRRTRVIFTPRDARGLQAGPGLADRFIVTPGHGARVTGFADAGAPGTYAIDVDWGAAKSPPALRIAQFGRPKEALLVPLARPVLRRGKAAPAD